MQLRIFLINLKRSWDYAKLGWNCPDWDQGYLYDHIAFKLKRMEAVQNRSFHTLGRKYAKRIKTARLCLERLSKEDYWPFESIDYSKNDYKLLEMAKREDELKKQDLKYFAKIFVKYSQGWWD